MDKILSLLLFVPVVWFLALIICAIVGLEAFVVCAAIFLVGVVVAHLYFVKWNKTHGEEVRGVDRVMYTLHSWLAPIANMLFNWRM